MQNSAKSRWVIGLFGAAAAFLALVYVLPVVSASSTGSGKPGTCVKPQEKVVESGRNPSGNPWTITGTIANNNGCNGWLFGSEFVPDGKAAGSFAWQWGVPVNGHLSDDFTLSARDEALSSERVFGGAVGGRVTRMVAQMSSGGSLVIRPKLPPRSLREKVAWLRNVRYVMQFYPAGRHATKVTLYSADGKVIEHLRPIEGEFAGPGV